jgi:hypothetical protein
MKTLEGFVFVLWAESIFDWRVAIDPEVSVMVVIFVGLT